MRFGFKRRKGFAKNDPRGTNLACTSSLVRWLVNRWWTSSGFGVEFMRERFTQVATVLLILLLAAWVGQPYLDRLLFAATSPRPITTRSDLPESERATISLFERVSPSVVQVVGTAAGAS